MGFIALTFNLKKSLSKYISISIWTKYCGIIYVYKLPLSTQK